MIALSDKQLETVMAAAASLSPEKRALLSRADPRRRIRGLIKHNLKISDTRVA
jgi:hypothetical protein